MENMTEEQKAMLRQQMYVEMVRNDFFDSWSDRGYPDSIRDFSSSDEEEEDSMHPVDELDEEPNEHFEIDGPDSDKWEEESTAGSLEDFVSDEESGSGDGDEDVEEKENKEEDK